MEGQGAELFKKRESKESGPQKQDGQLIEKEKTPGESKEEAEEKERRIAQQIKENFKALGTVSGHVGEYLHLLYQRLPENRAAENNNAGILAWRHQREYHYPKGSFLEIEKIFTALPAMLSEMAKDPEIVFLSQNHVKHILGNSPQFLAYWADKRAAEFNTEGGDLNSPKRDTLEKIKTYKQVMDCLLAYLALIEQRKDILLQEMTKENGWFETLEKEYYIGKVPDKKSGWTEVMLMHYNFFARVQGWKFKLENLRLMPALTIPIETEADFETAFNALPHHEILNKETIREKLFKTRQLVQEKAA